MMIKHTLAAAIASVHVFTTLASAKAKEIVHDAEHYVLLSQYGERWAAEGKVLDAKLAALRDKNGGEPPNIIFILIDDVGFGELRSVELNQVRGYRTTSINKLARESLSLARMYTEPSCTPTRTVFLKGRMLVRSHMLEPKVVALDGVVTTCFRTLG